MVQANKLVKGDRGVRQARKHMTWYAKNFAGAADLQRTVERG